MKSNEEPDIFKIIQQIGNITIVFSVASLIWSVLPNKNQEIEEAWKVVESQDNIRKTKWIALEKLNKYGQSLEYLDLSKKDQNRYGAYLNEINLKEADLYRASLIRALVKEANLEGAKLQRSELIGVVFANTNLSRAQLQEADVEQAVFDQANIKEADFTRAKNLNPQQIGSSLLGMVR
ncbi:MAG: pentapeptide repeat-containing protein [Microcystis aeruginosa Ma_AC_P_19900807_S300]|nr:MAG: pentapeptide repeat-containing protein [Microcystis aeruginosa Ma_AC_P_19900807_S300]